MLLFYLNVQKITFNINLGTLLLVKLQICLYMCHAWVTTVQKPEHYFVKPESVHRVYICQSQTLEQREPAGRVHQHVGADFGNWYAAFITPIQHEQTVGGAGPPLPLTQCPHLSPFLACKQSSGRIANSGWQHMKQASAVADIVARWPSAVRPHKHTKANTHTPLLLIDYLMDELAAPVTLKRRGYSLTL